MGIAREITSPEAFFVLRNVPRGWPRVATVAHGTNSRASANSTGLWPSSKVRLLEAPPTGPVADPLTDANSTGHTLQSLVQLQTS